jgi:hypothetical protein
MTNYDIDEIIFPRYHNTTYIKHFNKSNKSDCKRELRDYSESREARNHHFNIYELAKSLNQIYGSNSACFHFGHFLLLNDYDQMYGLLRKEAEKNAIKSSFLYDYKNRTKIRFMLKDETHLEYAKSLALAVNYVTCINETFLESKRDVLDIKWTRSLGTIFTKRSGKSIFNTEHTLSIHQHSAHQTKPKSKRVSVPFDFGYTSHLRDGDIGSKIRKEEVLSLWIDLIRVDVEYMNFIVKISDKFSV